MSACQNIDSNNKETASNLAGICLVPPGCAIRSTSITVGAAATTGIVAIENARTL